MKNSNINNFFQKIKRKKHYVKTLKNKINLLKNINERNYKNLNFDLFFKNENLFLQNFLVTHIINISFIRKNTWLRVTNFVGEPTFCCSGGALYNLYKKKSRISLLKSMINLLSNKLKILSTKFIALHLKNTKLIKFWILKRFKKKFFIPIVKNFNLYAHNGCRKKKVRRKKLRVK